MTVRFISALILGFLTPMAGQAIADNPEEITLLEGVEARFHLAPQDVEKLGGKLLADFDVSPKGRFLLGIEGEGGVRNLIVPELGLLLLSENDPGLESFCRLQTGALIAIRNGCLARFDDGRLIEEVELPDQGMHLAQASAGDRFLVFGGKGRSARTVYEVLEGRRYRKLAEAPDPITAVIEIARRLYLAIGSEVIGVPENGPSTIAYQAPPNSPPITSLAFDPETRTLYIATADGITALREGTALGVVAGCGGQILFRTGSLYVLDADRSLLVEFPEISRSIRGNGDK